MFDIVTNTGTITAYFLPMKNLNYTLRLCFAALFLLVVAVSCSKIVKVTDAITNPSAREVYAREFKDDKTLFNNWENSYKAAFNDSIQIYLPYGEKGIFRAKSNAVFNYVVKMEEGEVLTANVVADSIGNRVFIDFFQMSDSIYRPFADNEAGSKILTKEIKDGGMYKVIIQPEIAAGGKFFININKQPAYGFPVAGKSNDAIGSFWGGERDGGKRTHEGIDIFAKRGTPVVAVTDGIVSRTGDRGLGGKQVWQRDVLFGYSLYYAHLDTVIAVEGTRVKAGDTLGLVGNTGNAKTTPPHLHFGIYRGFGGAVNPLPFVFKTAVVNAMQFPLQFTSGSVKLKSTANVRKGPDTTYTKIGELKANDTVTVLGQHKEWLHIITPSGQKAFLSKSLVK